ncbi:MAG: type III pantothenate kinase [Winogradskyella sp.]
MNLIVDVGNTFVKFAVFSQNRLNFKQSFELSHFKERYQHLKKRFPKLKSAIVSSVGKLPDDHLRLLQKDIDVLLLNHQIELPFINSYSTPKTLGVDRIALVSASVNQFPNHDVLIIDAGTCITYDFISNKNEYLGGAISPGIRLRYKSLNDFTANLPLLEKSIPENITGNSTESSIHSGVVMGVTKELDGVIDNYLLKYPDLKIILTGGDTEFLGNQLKNSIFANANFLLEGLNFILEFNSSNK